MGNSTTGAAAQRGLKNLRTTVDALPELITPEAIELFEKYAVFSEREMHSRYEIGLEQYALSIGVEARLVYELGSTIVLPAALRYQTEIALNIQALKGEHALKVLLPAMAGARAAADALEGVVADDLWSLPTYQEMLYVL